MSLFGGRYCGFLRHFVKSGTEVFLYGEGWKGVVNIGTLGVSALWEFWVERARGSLATYLRRFL